MAHPSSSATTSKITQSDVLRELKRGSTPPVIVLTAEQAPRERRTALGLGADLFLTKPFSPLELIEAVERLLGPEPE